MLHFPIFVMHLDLKNTLNIIFVSSEYQLFDDFKEDDIYELNAY